MYGENSGITGLKNEHATSRSTFAPTSSALERIKAYLDAGLSVEELATLVGVSENAVRRWADGTALPRRRAERVLDDLRTVFAALEEADISGPEAVSWLRSRNREWLANERPLDILPSDPLLVLAAAEPEPSQSATQERARRLRSIR